MAIIAISNIVPLSSTWTTRKTVSSVRTLLDETDNSKISDMEIRQYINLCISTVASQTGAETSYGDYGVVLKAQIDDRDPIPYIALNKPVDITNPQREIGETTFTPFLDVNPFATHRNAAMHQDKLEPVTENVFNEDVNLIMNYEYYTRFVIPSSVISQIKEIGFEFEALQAPSQPPLLPAWEYESKIKDYATKLSMSEILHLHKQYKNEAGLYAMPSNQITHNDSCAYTYHGGRIYFYFGSEFIAEHQPASNNIGPTWNFHIFAVRAPLLDNLKDTNTPESGWWQNIDIQDKHVRLVVLMVVKMCFDKLNKRISPDIESALTQAMAMILQGIPAKQQIAAADRMKTDEGFMTR
jgi:hypothetical protein